MLSLETYILSRNYTDEAVISSQQMAIDEAVAEAVAQSKIYTDQMISVASFDIEIVETLPTSDISTHTIYLVPKNRDDFNNSYYEYIYINNKWELIGHTDLDLSDYWTKEEVKEYVNSVKYVLKPATGDTLGGVMVDIGTIQLDEYGKISLNVISDEDITKLF